MVILLTAFQKSLSTYIRRYQAQNAKTEDLWNVLSEVSGEPVDLMMNTWTKKTGYPVIHVELIDHILELKQVLWSFNKKWLANTYYGSLLSETVTKDCLI